MFGLYMNYFQALARLFQDAGNTNKYISVSTFSGYCDLLASHGLELYELSELF